MRFIEYKAKEIIKKEGFKIPKAFLIKQASDIPTVIKEVGLPMVMKVQILSGGRGKAGGIHIAKTEAEVKKWYHKMIGTEIKGFKVVAILCEQYMLFKEEYYLSFTFNTTSKEILFLFSPEGGVDVESNEKKNSLFKINISKEEGLENFKLVEILSKANIPIEQWDSIIEIIQKLYKVFLKYDCMLLEVNPFVWTRNKEFHILDIHFYIDDDAVNFQQEARETVLNNPDLYPQSWLKTKHGFDMVTLNENGTVALLSTGAGLSMALIDEMKSRNLEPINFADIRSGQLKGDATRLVVLLERFKQFKNIKYIFVSIFAGITDLAEFARLLMKAKEEVTFDNPVEWIIRLEGVNYDRAEELISEKGLFITNSLEQALNICIEKVNEYECIN